LPTPAAEAELAAPIALPEHPEAAGSQGIQSQIIENNFDIEQEEPDDNPPNTQEGESDNKVIAQSNISFGAGLIGLSLVTCAGCFAMIFGVLAAKDIEKDVGLDHLEQVLDAEEDILGTTVTSDVFEAPTA